MKSFKLYNFLILFDLAGIQRQHSRCGGDRSSLRAGHEPRDRPGNPSRPPLAQVPNRPGNHRENGDPTSRGPLAAIFAGWLRTACGVAWGGDRPTGAILEGRVQTEPGGPIRWHPRGRGAIE